MEGNAVWFEAAKQGDVATLRALGCTVLSTSDVRGYTPAHHAVMQGRVKALQCLRELVPEALSAQDNDGRTPAHQAAEYGHVKALEYLHELA